MVRDRKVWVTPEYVETRGLRFLWWISSVKIVCGECGRPFESKLQYADTQNHWCVYCGTRNRFYTEWEN